MGPGDQSSLFGQNDNLKVPKLSEDGSNWVLYKSQFTSAVIAKKLRRYLNSTAKEPPPTTAPGVDPDADEKYQDALDVYESCHATIKTLLFQTLPEPLKLKILSKTKANECWKIVTDTFDQQGDFVQVDLLRQMNSLHCAEEDPRPTLLELQRLKSEYATAGGTLNDQQYKAMILSSLPESYRPTVCTILTSAQISKTTLTAEDLLLNLYAIARDDSTINSGGATDSALAANSSKIKCFNCNKLGHKKDDCWSKGGGKEGQGPRRRNGKGKGKGKEGTSANVLRAKP